MPTLTVDEFLGSVVHPLKSEILRLRELIQNACPDLTEHIKWNAPSFCHYGDDRITFKLHPPTQVSIIFHRGVKKSDPDTPAFHDPTRLLKLLAPDRGIVTFKSAEEVGARADQLTELVRAWLAESSA